MKELVVGFPCDGSVLHGEDGRTRAQRSRDGELFTVQGGTEEEREVRVRGYLSDDCLCTLVYRGPCPVHPKIGEDHDQN